jgi:P4 family phage/plasmid primase-like protien
MLLVGSHYQGAYLFDAYRADGTTSGHVAIATNGVGFDVGGEPPRKQHTLRGSTSGIVGQRGRGLLADAAVVWKTEGITDMLALQSVAPAGTCVITTAAGAGDRPKKDLVEALAGKKVYVVHDCDRAGRAGVAHWALPLAETADVRDVLLPFEVTESNGKDLRDYLQEHSFEDLLALAEKAAPAEPPPPGGEEAGEPSRDAHWWAGRFLAEHTYAGHQTVRLFKSEWFWWENGRYRVVDEGETRDLLVAFIKKTIDAEGITTQGRFGETLPMPVTVGLVNNVFMALRSTCRLSGRYEMPLMIGDDAPGTNRVAFHNHVLDVDAYLADKPDHFTPLTPRWFSTVALPYDHDPGADCPRWKQVVGEILEGDTCRIDLLQEWFGWLLVRDTGEQKFLMLEGEGSNGKSVVCAAMEAMLGVDNVSHVPLESFGQRFQLTATLGRLANIVSEVGYIDRSAEAQLKQFTSGDRMFFDRKGIPGVEATPTARLVFATNNRPTFSDRSRGLWRRLILMPFNVEIPEGKKVKGMHKVEWWEESGELPGILNWALAGLRRLRKQGGFTGSTVCDEALGEYQIESNPARQFLLETCRAVEGGFANCSSIYRYYVQWCEDHGHRQVLSDNIFGKEVRRAFKGVSRNKRQVAGVRAQCYFGLGYNPGGRAVEDGLEE